MLQQTTKILVIDPRLTNAKRMTGRYDVLDTANRDDMSALRQAQRLDLPARLIGPIMIDTSNNIMYVKSTGGIDPLKVWMQ